jgi:hypothetical protein
MILNNNNLTFKNAKIFLEVFNTKKWGGSEKNYIIDLTINDSLSLK